MYSTVPKPNENDFTIRVSVVQQQIVPVATLCLPPTLCFCCCQKYAFHVPAPGNTRLNNTSHTHTHTTTMCVRLRWLYYICSDAQWICVFDAVVMFVARRRLAPSLAYDDMGGNVLYRDTHYLHTSIYRYVLHTVAPSWISVPPYSRHMISRAVLFQKYEINLLFEYAD